jgi:hypothetical protein
MTLVSIQGFSLTLLQESFFTFQQARGLSGYTSPHGECSASLLTYPPYRLRSLSGYTSSEMDNFKIYLEPLTSF